MFTFFSVLVFFVLIVPLAIAAQRWLFKETEQLCDREWEVYQQRYD
jgi:hypothetical protein